MNLFFRLGDGTMINKNHIVQLTPERHLQMSSGNTITLNEEDHRLISDLAIAEPELWNMDEEEAAAKPILVPFPDTKDKQDEALAPS